MADYKSPTGSPILGTAETVPATALISGINDDGSPEYAGGSVVHWNEQKTNMSATGQILFIDDDGEEWTFNQLVKVEAEIEVDEE